MAPSLFVKSTTLGGYDCSNHRSLETQIMSQVNLAPVTAYSVTIAQQPNS